MRNCKMQSNKLLKNVIRCNKVYKVLSSSKRTKKTKCVQTDFEITNDEKLQTFNEKIVCLQETIRLLQSESVATEERVENASKGLQIMLATAKDSINSLQ